MKILMINKFLYPRGGAESYVLQLGECLRTAGHTVEFFGMYDEKNTVGNTTGQYTQNMDFHAKAAERFLYPFKIIYSHMAKKKLGRVLDSFRPDVVHMNNINFQLTPSVIYAVKKRNIPLVQTVHDYQMICPNHLLYNFAENRPCAKCVTGSKLNCFRYRCIHASAVKSLLGTMEAWLYAALKTYKLVDLYICPSCFLEQKLICAHDFYKDKTYRLCNFIEKPKVCGAYDGQNPYIVYVGRLSKEKGISLLAQAARLLPDYRFVAIGNGPDAAELEGIPNVELRGFLTGEALTAAVAAAKALILPSVCYENCPLTILEAHAMGVPVITMNSGGMAELVEDDVTGTLIHIPTPVGVAEAVLRLTEDEDTYRHIRENCKRASQSIMTAQTYADALTAQYQGLIARRKQP